MEKINPEVKKNVLRKTAKGEQNEKEREIFLRNLKAAEVLSLIDLKTASKEELEKAVEKLKEDYSESVIEKAARVADLREKGIDVYKKLIREQKVLKNKNLSDICKEYQKKGRREYDFFESRNFYHPAIIDLKKTLLEEKEKNLRKEIENDPILSKLSPQEKEEDINKKLREYEALYLARMVIAEKAREQELRMNVYYEEKMESVGIVKKSLISFARLPRGLRSAIGAAVFGAGVATFAPGLVIGSASTYIAYRAVRAFTGGSIAGALQKIFGNKIVDAIYRKGVDKSFQRLTKQLEGEEKFEAGKEREAKIMEFINKIFGPHGGLKSAFYEFIGKGDKVEKIQEEKKEEKKLEEEIQKGMNELDELIKAKNYEKIAEFNLKLAEYQMKVLHKHEVVRRFTTLVTITATGVIGGAVGMNLIDGLFGPKSGAILLNNLQEKSLKPQQPVFGDTVLKKEVSSGAAALDTTNLPHQNFPPIKDSVFNKIPEDLPKSPSGAINQIDTISQNKIGGGVVLEAQNARGSISVMENIPSEKQLEIATVGKGEGVEHAFIRQLEADPQKFGYKGDLNDHLAIKKWAGAEAHRIAIENKYVDPQTGTEIRVRDLGESGKAGNPAYILDIDSSNRIKVTEYLDGKPTSGEGLKNVYEYEWTKPKFSNLIDPQTLKPKPLEFLTEKDLPAIPKELETLPSYSLPKTYLVSHLEDNVLPKIKSYSYDFEKMSLLEQENIIEEIKNSSGQFMKRLSEFRDSLTDRDIEIMGEVNKHWGEIMSYYIENHKMFVDVIKKTVDLNDKDLQLFLDTRVDKVWDVLKDKKFEKAFDLLRKVNPTSKELISKMTVEDILKSRFVKGKFW